MTTSDQIQGLYSRPMPSRRSGPIYNAFSYPTKIDAEAIAVFIASHTEPGATVLDVFGGSGSTGIAVRLCDRPTDRMREMAQDLGVTPSWGPREAFIYEISPLGALLSDVMCNPPDPEAFAAAAQSLISNAQNELGWMYDTEDAEGTKGELRHTIWSEVLVTPCCQVKISLWDATVTLNPVKMSKDFECPECGRSARVSECERAMTRFEDPLTGQKASARERVIARIYGRTDSATFARTPTRDDRLRAEKCASAQLPFAPTPEIEWGDLYRAGYHTGIERFHQLYTPRNLRAFSAVWTQIDEQPSDLQDALCLWALSYNAAHSTLLTRVVAKKNQADFVVSGAQSGVLYVSGLPVEKNIFAGMKRKISTFQAAFEQTAASQSTVRVVCGSSTELDVPDRSVDYVFTDPPFGDFIPYAEVNQVNEAWLGRLTDRTEEAIISPAQEKGVDEYADLMRQVFGEVRRVLRDDGFATVVFHASKPEVWKALGDAFGKNDLTTVLTSVLDKTQVSFKQVVSEGSTRGDAVFLLEPAAASHNTTANDTLDVGGIVDEILHLSKNDPTEATPRRVYSRYVARCIQVGASVAMTASDFYRWFEERDRPVELQTAEV